MQLAKAYLATTFVFLLIDAIWLGVIAKPFFVGHLGHLLREQPHMLAAALFYLFFCMGLVYFAVIPAFGRGSWLIAMLNGGFLGALAYGTYEITNYATLDGWPIAIVAVDIAWGSALSAVSALVGYWIVRRA